MVGPGLMKRRALAAGACVAVLLAGCEAPPVTPPAAPPPASTGGAPLIYDCESGQEVRVAYTEGGAALVCRSRVHALRTVATPTGARFIGEGLEWWIVAADGGRSRFPVSLSRVRGPT